VVLHAGADDLSLTLPGRPWATSYELLVDTARHGHGADVHQPGVPVAVTGRSVLLFRACR
jgi:glycogen operon protein